MNKKTLRNNPCYCINFRHAANSLTKFYDQGFSSMDLTTNQFSLLNDIAYLKECNKSELAIHARVERTTIIRNLNILFEKGLIEEIAGKNNRNKLIRLTEKGKKAKIEGMEIWKELQEKVESLLGNEQITIFEDILTSLGSLKF
ncbi:MarR family winged helix-turn-helix transcriptional regulator [Fusobacterium sp. PH5-44]|uniref:MarR family winged helix-turn-helix transcriptional regulator n=1 Tax=unclassified Fusobacterium TaxID=2648384 RepID=UPI003D210197